jgi:asparagine synthase (glutamine-hydrolysing)
MCGIAGVAFSRRSGRSAHVAALRAMCDVIRHRGPDDEGYFVDNGIGLGHRRLSIVDVAAGHQPMTNEDGSLRITYNGEIYNHADFRSDLEARGHVYKTHCDTETILHLYEEHGEACVNYLRGMFSFAIWDAKTRKLFIARDRLGVKPLYYSQTQDGSLYFGSEIKTLLASEGFKPEINFSALPDYLANHAPSGEDSLFKGIKRLLPGHTLTWEDGKIAISCFWDISLDRDGDEKESDVDYISEWKDLFYTSVRLRLMADVPLGMFLSGGIDSSAIAAVMSAMVKEPIKTFSVGFAERNANELEYARLVANTFKTNHHEVIVTPEMFFEALPHLVWHEDEPLAHLASVPLYFVSILAAQHVKVVLTGEGSDELLAGYYRYRTTVYNQSLGKKYQRLTTSAIRNLVKKSVQSLPEGSTGKRKLVRTFLCLTPDLETIYFDNFAVFPRNMQEHLLTADVKAQIGTNDPYQAVRKLLENTDGVSLLNRLLYADTKTYLHELLMKQDQMSMAASIESRVPFLDHKLVEFTAKLPDRLKLRGWTTKYILRESMRGLLPESILKRKKMGFPVPVGTWFRGRFRSVIDEYVLSDRTLARGLFDPGFIKNLVASHQSGAGNHAERLWSLVNLEIWLRQFIDGESLSSSRQFEYQKTKGVAS